MDHLKVDRQSLVQYLHPFPPLEVPATLKNSRELLLCCIGALPVVYLKFMVSPQAHNKVVLVAGCINKVMDHVPV